MLSQFSIVQLLITQFKTFVVSLVTAVPSKLIPRLPAVAPPPEILMFSSVTLFELS